MVEVEVRSLSSFSADTTLVRFSTVRTDPGGQRQEPQLWAAVIKCRFSGDAMTASDRLLNPLGFQVVRYRRDPEMVAAEPAAYPSRTVVDPYSVEVVRERRTR
jgi:type IV secretion system protein VirB8